MALRWTNRLARSFCTAGILLGTLFFAASLTPSLLPRTPLMQGILSGVSFAAGYGIGVGARWLWTYLELRVPSRKAERFTKLGAAVICLAVVVYSLWRAAEWQNSTRILMEMEPVGGAEPIRVGVVALAVFAILVVFARAFQWTIRSVSRWLTRVMPRRLSHVLGFVVAVTLFWSIANGVIFNAGLRLADSSYRQLDALIESEIEEPSDPMKTGSPASLMRWEELGRTGREYISTGPAREDLKAFHAENALEPIRVYAGLNSAETIEERARLALEELKRVNAFDRSALVLITPTGTGWVDPSAIDTLEYLLAGDVASVTVQYSYLASWLSLMVEPGYGADTARALFTQVYEHWTSLPEEERPRLYLHGLSLGALNSEISADLYDVIGDPFHGALWSGPPFPSPNWRAATEGRVPDSPAWLPRFRDSSIIRFTNQFETLDIPGATWGPMRIVYLQYASDPITFFEPEILYRRPDWLEGERGPDVSARLRWFPVVTFLQLAVDIPAATNTPMGYGHVFAPEHYIRAWREITDPPGWSDEDTERLKSYFRQRR